jgi:hypothetical protein
MLANSFRATVTVVCPPSSLQAFLVDSLMNDSSFAYPLLYNAILEQIFDACSFFAGYTFQLANQSLLKLDHQPVSSPTQRPPLRMSIKSGNLHLDLQFTKKHIWTQASVGVCVGDYLLIQLR